MGTAATLDEAWALVEAGQAHGVGSFDADGQPNTGLVHFTRGAADLEAQRHPDAGWQAFPKGRDPFEQYWKDRREAAAVLDAVKRSGAKSKNEYDAWRAAQSKPEDWPTYKTLQRRITGKRKPGAVPGPDLRKPNESAWDAALRLARARKT